MKLNSLNLPTESADRAVWLDRQLVGLELGDLVLELEAIAAPSTSIGSNSNSIDEILGTQREAVLSDGLSAIDSSQFKVLLQQPRLLFDLQELVLIEGGGYWIQLSQQADHAPHARQASDVLSLVTATNDTPVSLPTSNQNNRRNWMPIAILAAAAVVIAVGLSLLNDGGNQVASGWGFDRNGVLTADISAPEYLDTLASAAGDWFNKRPRRAEGLAKRLGQFSHGCETLISAPHPQLADADRAWLVERCGVWKGKLDTQLAQLESGEKSYEEIVAESDETINKLIDALKARSDAIKKANTTTARSVIPVLISHNA